MKLRRQTVSITDRLCAIVPLDDHDTLRRIADALGLPSGSTIRPDRRESEGRLNNATGRSRVIHHGAGSEGVLEARITRSCR